MAFSEAILQFHFHICHSPNSLSNGPSGGFSCSVFKWQMSPAIEPSNGALPRHFRIAFSDGTLQLHILLSFKMDLSKGFRPWLFRMAFPRSIFQLHFPLAFSERYFFDAECEISNLRAFSDGIFECHFKIAFTNAVLQRYFTLAF